MGEVLTAGTNGSLLEQALQGDEPAFEALAGPLVEPGLRLAFSILGDRLEAEDATQEAITQAWVKLRQLRDERLIRPWFLSIVRRRCLNVRRGRWFRTLRVAELFRPARTNEPLVEKLDLERGLAKLPSDDRQALFLHFYLDLPIEEVAGALGISPRAAKGRIYRACHRLRPGLVEEDLS